jgi:RNA polymerase sigma-70 factor (sigma-E family)
MGDTFSDYVTVRGAALLRFAFVLCGDRYLAEDLVQDVLARIHRRWAHVEATESPEAYIRKSIVHEYLSWRRRLASRELVVADLPESRGLWRGGGPEMQMASRDQMWRLLATLPRTQRVVLTLRFYEDMTFDEIAAVLGCAQATVRVHASRGLTRLRVDLKTQAGLEGYDNAALGGRA